MIIHLSTTLLTILNLTLPIILLLPTPLPNFVVVGDDEEPRSSGCHSITKDALDDIEDYSVDYYPVPP